MATEDFDECMTYGGLLADSKDSKVWQVGWVGGHLH